MIFAIAFLVNLNPTATRMWLGYIVAPILAPVSFVVLGVLVAVLSGSAFDYPAGVLIRLFSVLFWGTLASYVVAGILGMPIAFFLQRAHRLNGFSIHAAALVWAFVFSISAAIITGGGVRLAILALFGLTVPILLSATAFWAIAGYDDFAKLQQG